MKDFLTFFNEEYGYMQFLEYLDKNLFAKIIKENAEYEPTPDELIDSAIDYQALEREDEAALKKYNFDQDAERELIKIYKENPNSIEGGEAMKKIIEMKLPYIKMLANNAAKAKIISFQNVGDAINNAVLSLIHAIDYFDLSLNIPFTAYAKNWIQAGIKNPFNPNRQTSVSSDLYGKKGVYIQSFDAPSNGSGEDNINKDETNYSFSELLDSYLDGEGGTSNDPSDILNNKEIKNKIMILVKKLSDKEQKALKLRHTVKTNDGKEYTFEEIGKEIGMTKMGAKKLIERAYEKIRNAVKEEFGDDFEYV
jgi:RNA polymerase sigma factor (sigma-70 family)